VALVSADLPDFRDMDAGENMAIRFYRTGDPADLAEQLVALLESPSLRQQAAEQNYAAALRMTMPNIVRNYLRWFELKRRRQSLDTSGRWRFSSRWWQHSLRSSLSLLPPPAGSPDRVPPPGMQAP
jgi:hypothetical protein